MYGLARPCETFRAELESKETEAMEKAGAVWGWMGCMEAGTEHLSI